MTSRPRATFDCKECGSQFNISRDDDERLAFEVKWAADTCEACAFIKDYAPLRVGP